MAQFPERLPAESARAYEAAQTYFAMGADRSIDAVGQKLAKSRPLLKRWSAQHDWVGRARTFDAALSIEAAEAASAKYLADLEVYRQQSRNAGDALYSIAQQLLIKITDLLQQPPQIVEGKDGRTYRIPGIALNAQTFAIVARVLVVAIDLKAFALRVDRLLNELEANDHQSN